MEGGGILDGVQGKLIDINAPFHFRVQQCHRIWGLVKLKKNPNQISPNAGPTGKFSLSIPARVSLGVGEGAGGGGGRNDPNIVCTYE
jgi:hypothetical protein